ncbi:unnamed protein product, partial [Symbiodinium pilosum]
VDTIWSKGDQPTPPDPEREKIQAERKERWKQVREKNEKDPNHDVFVNSRRSPKRFASAIKEGMQVNGRAVMRAVGERSTNTALKALAIANEMMQGTDLRGEQVLGAVPYFKQVKLDDKDDVANVLFLECMLLPRPRLEDITVEDKQILTTGDKDKMPKMAAAIKNRLRENPAAVVLGKGPRQLHLAVKTIMLAGRFLREDEGESGARLKVPAVAIMPNFQEMAPRIVKSRKFMKKGEDDPVTIGMRLECIDVRDRWEQSAERAEDLRRPATVSVAAPWEASE